MRRHRLFTDLDKRLPEQILDRNGQVVLSCCKFCGKAEAELNDGSGCTPDFEALRAKRNANFESFQREFAEAHEVPLQNLRSSFDPNSCYCACGSKDNGPCEHNWDGPEWTSDDGLASSCTCSRCGTTAMSHDMRFAP